MKVFLSPFEIFSGPIDDGSISTIDLTTKNF
jgi:hypothetical protein